MATQRTQLEIINFAAYPDLTADYAKTLTSAMYLNEIPVHEGWAVYLIMPKMMLNVRRLLIEGMGSPQAAEAWIVSTFRTKTYSMLIIADPKEYFAEAIRQISTGNTK